MHVVNALRTKAEESLILSFEKHKSAFLLHFVMILPSQLLCRRQKRNLLGRHKLVEIHSSQFSIYIVSSFDKKNIHFFDLNFCNLPFKRDHPDVRWRTPGDWKVCKLARDTPEREIINYYSMRNEFFSRQRIFDKLCRNWTFLLCQPFVPWGVLKWRYKSSNDTKLECHKNYHPCSKK